MFDKQRFSIRIGLLISLLSFLTACSGNTALEGTFAPDPQLQESPQPTVSPNGQTTTLPDSFPTQIPQFPQAQLIAVEPGLSATQGKTRWTSSLSSNEVETFYQQQLTDNNWEIIQPFSLDENNRLIARQDGLEVQIAIVSTSPTTEFTIDYQTGENTATQPTPTPSVTPSVTPSITPIPTQTAVNFIDLEQVPEALRRQVQDLAALGVLTGENSQFNPNKTLTRREFARWLVTANNTLNASIPAKQIRLGEKTAQPAFQDVRVSDPDFVYIQGLAEAGLIPSQLSGDTSALLFRPNAPLTREDLLTSKVPLDLRKALPSATIDSIKATWGFQDTTKINPKALRAIYADFQNGDQANIRRVYGYTTLLQPKKPVTRAEAAAALWYFGYQGDGISGEEALQIQNQTQATN